MTTNYIDAKKIGQKLQAARIQQNISQEHLAQLCYITPSYLSLIESGHRNVSLDTFALLCHHLNISSDYLLFDTLYSIDTSVASVLESVKAKGDATYHQYLKTIKALADVSDQLT